MRAPAVTVSNRGGTDALEPGKGGNRTSECDGGKGPFSTAQDDGKPAWALGGLALRYSFDGRGLSTRCQRGRLWDLLTSGSLAFISQTGARDFRRLALTRPRHFTRQCSWLSPTSLDVLPYCRRTVKLEAGAEFGDPPQLSGIFQVYVNDPTPAANRRVMVQIIPAMKGQMKLRPWDHSLGFICPLMGG